MVTTTPNTLILAHLIKDRLARWPERDVLTFVDVARDGSFLEETRTYRQLWDNGQRIAAALDAEGMKPGHAFGIVAQNHPEFVDAMVGSSIAGTVFVPIDPRTKGKKLAYMLEFAECKGAVVGAYSVDAVLEVAAECPSLEWIWVIGGEAKEAAVPQKALADILEAHVEERPVAVDDPLLPMQMLYTSGTTGDPKAILSPYARFGTIASLGGALGLNDGDRTYTGLSLTHANAQLITLGATLHMGLRGVISRRFTKSRLWDITRRYGCTMFNLLGGMTTAIYSEPELPNDADNPVRYVLSAGMPAALWEKFEKRFGLKVFEFYGAAEGGLTMNPPGGPVGSIGKPPPTLIGEIVDEEDAPCAPGVPGEIIFKNADGSLPAVAYFKNAEATAAKVRGGWLRMGDIGYKDADGWYYFLYRKGGGIRRNGDFINPAFVEKELAEHPLVDDVFVYGVPASNGVPGEKDVVAAIVAVKDQPFDAASVFAWCRARLESSFVPQYLQVVPEIPKTASEKPQERFLLEAFKVDGVGVYTE
ncbi:MAG: AMP-binding protein [Gammaproteobacteria bacterium]|nr:AMP-binding protein [Gammaproteobacteria bacterium]MBI5616926.1 AMP-binding protein [Gammaproteobacteria bacterium]